MSSYWNPYDSAFFKVQLLVVSVSGFACNLYTDIIERQCDQAYYMYAPFDTLIKKEKLFVIIS